MGFFKHTDWLKEFQIGIGIITGILTGLTLLQLGGVITHMVAGDSQDSPVTVGVPADYETTMAEPGPGLNDRAELAGNGTIEVVITDPTPGEYGLYVLIWLPGAAVTIAVALMLFLLIRNARKAEPFTAGTVRRLRAMGLVALVGGSAAGLVAILGNFMLSSGVVTVAASATGGLPFGWMLGGIAVFAIADVVARGQRMREDLDGVI